MTSLGYPNTLHGMLDLEAASSGNNAAVLTIGFLAFDPMKPRDVSSEYGTHIVVPFEHNKGADITLDTISWWMQQTPEAQRAAWVDERNPEDHRFFADDIANLTSWFEKVNDIWANDPDFDCVILRNFLERMGIKWRWHRKHRSLRTIKTLFDMPEIADQGTAHNALDDCIYQAEFVRAVYQGRAPLRIAQANPATALPPALDSSIA